MKCSQREKNQITKCKISRNLGLTIMFSLYKRWTQSTHKGAASESHEFLCEHLLLMACRIVKQKSHLWTTRYHILKFNLQYSHYVRIIKRVIKKIKGSNWAWWTTKPCVIKRAPLWLKKYNKIKKKTSIASFHHILAIFVQHLFRIWL